jgi:hypothetical protein
MAEVARAGYAQRGVFSEMAARRSFYRSTSKFEPDVDKPVAILTAFRGEVPLAENRRANAQLADDLKGLDLGFYPVKGAGQEVRLRFGLIPIVVPSSEESFIVQPRAHMTEEAFVSKIQGLLRKYSQFAAMMKLPSFQQSFLLHSDGDRVDIGSSVGPTTVQARAHASPLLHYAIAPQDFFEKTSV